MSQKTVVISNRLPIIIEEKNGKTSIKINFTGGLVTALHPYFNQNLNCFWIGSIHPNIKLTPEVNEQLAALRFIPVQIEKGAYNEYYNKICNNFFWPLFHYFPTLSEFDKDSWIEYKKVNQIFADKITQIFSENDLFWIHDYHFMILPQYIREKFKTSSIGYFHHIPFPTSEVFKTLPIKNEVLNGLLGADTVCFHTLEYSKHFLTSTCRFLGNFNDAENIYSKERIIRVGAFPIGIDLNNIHKAKVTKEYLKKSLELKNKYEEKIIVLGIDRLDYTKGIKEKLLGFESFLKKNPDLSKKVVLIQVCVPTRTQISNYNHLRSEVEQIVGRINGEFGTESHIPILYLYRSFQFNELSALYSVSQICLVTPLRDGLNLVCKEYVACNEEHNGMLILSEFAGAAEEMGEAITINPYDTEQIADAIYEAIHIPNQEKAKRMKGMRSRIFSFDNLKWSSSFLEFLSETTEMNHKNRNKILTYFELKDTLQKNNNKTKIIAVDIDDILAYRKNIPVNSLSKKDLLEKFIKLKNKMRENDIEIILLSSENKEVILNNIPEDNFWISCEEGGHIYNPQKNLWHEENFSFSLESYKIELLKIYEKFTSRVPRSFIQEQKESLVLDFRHSTSSFTNVLALSYCEIINQILIRSNFHCIVNRNRIEVRSINYNKGISIQKLVAEMKCEDFLLITIGDGKTDKNMFKVFDDKNLSICIGASIVNTNFIAKDFSEISKIFDESFKN